MSIFRIELASSAKMDVDSSFGMDHFPSDLSSLVLGLSNFGNPEFVISDLQKSVKSSTL